MDLSTPQIMGILNLSPDSFFDGGRYSLIEDAVIQTEKMLKEGATFIDIGGQSTRPGSHRIEADEEWKRIEPVLKALTKSFPEIYISIDTYHSSVARKAVDSGACMINDISAGSFDPAMFETAADLRCPYILMHMRGIPETMQKAPVYTDVINDVTEFFREKLDLLSDYGMHDIILDPGFGFGKTLEHNYKLLGMLDYFALFDRPLLAGISRKSMISKLLECNTEETLNGTTAANTIALMKGAKLLRVHDVREARDAIKIYMKTQVA